MIRLISRHSVRHAWPAYVGAFVALTFGVVLIGLAVTLIAAVEATASTTGVTAAERAELEGLSSLFGTMSSVAMFMALFVVGSTFGFVVASRRRELGLLRLVGATPGQVRRVVLGESAVVASAATVVGCLVSTAVAPAALWLVRVLGVTDLHLATLNGKGKLEIVRHEGRLGVIEPGAFADLLLVDGDPLADLGLLQDGGAHLAAIMKGGRFHKYAM